MVRATTYNTQKRATVFMIDDVNPSRSMQSKNDSLRGGSNVEAAKSSMKRIAHYNGLARRALLIRTSCPFCASGNV